MNGENTKTFAQKFDAAFEVACDLLNQPVWISGDVDDRAALLKNRGQELRLLHAQTLLELKRIPRSDEGYTISVAEAKKICEEKGREFHALILSHRWVRPLEQKPDDDLNSKCCALTRYTRYGQDTYGHEAFWWVDYACINQDDPAEGIAFLPCYIAALDGVLCYDRAYKDNPEEDYFQRPWCRIEMMIALAYTSPRLWFYDPFSAAQGYQSKFKAPKVQNNGAGWFSIMDPTEESVIGNLTDQRDLPALQKLRHLAVSNFPTLHERWTDQHKGTNQPVLDFVNNQVWYWRMEDFVRYQETQHMLAEDGWLLSMA
jgi:hypothetical protein